MDATLEIGFAFSACFEAAEGLIAHNYTLRLLTEPLGRDEEKRLRRTVDDGLIARIASRDLGRDVDFLKGKNLSEQALLDEFWQVVTALIAPKPLFRLSLERGDGTRLALSARAR